MRTSILVLLAVWIAACTRSTETAAPVTTATAATRTPKTRVPVAHADPALRAAINASLQREAGIEFAVTKDLRAKNPAHGLDLAFDARGARLAGKAGGTPWRATVALAGFGCRGAVRPVAPARAVSAANRVDYRRPAAAGFGEWYLNGPLGLEFGYTLARDPGCAEAIFEVGVAGVDPALAGDRVALRQGGVVVAQVGETIALDARGRVLPARLDVAAGRLQVRVDVTGAVYPIEIDPLIFTEVARVAPELQANATFGAAVAIHGDTAVFGAPLAYHSAAVPAQCCGTTVCQTGAVWVYVRGATGWQVQARLERPLGEAFHLERYGHAVDVSGDTLVVGAYNADANVDIPGPTAGCYAGKGVALVYTRSGTTWTQTGKLEASDGYQGDQFGYAVAIDQNTIVVGANVDDSATLANHGSAYVFFYNGATWSEQQHLVGTAAGDHFGAAVAVDGDSLVVGAPRRLASSNGSARVFVRSAGIWSQQGLLTAADGAVDDGFGAAVAISGYTAVVGAPYHDHGAADSGAAYVFTRALTVWSEQQELRASDAAAGDRYGTSVALDGDKAVVGAPQAQVGPSAGELDPWVNLFSGTAPASLTTSAFQVSPGDGRFLVVAIQLEKVSDSTGATLSATFGGVPMLIYEMNQSNSLTTRNISASEHAALYFLPDAAIPAGPQTLVLTFSGTGVAGAGLHVKWASYQGIDQQFPINDMWRNATPSTSPNGNVTFGSTVDFRAGGVTLFVAGNAGAASTMTPPAGFTTRIATTSDGHSTFAASTPPHAALGNFLGSTTVTIGDTTSYSSAVVGMSLRPSLQHGAVYVSKRTGTLWIEETKLRAANLVPDANLGTAVAFSPGAVVAGAPLEDDSGFNQAGAGYFFVQPGAPCVNPEDCPGGNFCIDGVCCTSACDQPCQSCKLAGFEGTCTAVTSADDPDTCTGDQTCSAAGVCLLDRGLTCDNDTECASGACADHVCCDGACDGECESCALVATPGTCTPIAAGTDPETECGTGPCAGSCTGARACGNYPGAATTCGAPSCSGATLDPADTCDGAGSCTATPAVLCADHLVCATASACLTECAQQPDCVTNYWCNTSSKQCLAKKAAGLGCGDGFECLSDTCVDGVCCSSDCDGTCERCDLAASPGTCLPVADGDDQQNECTGTGTCGGVCDGARACRFPGSTITCAPASCTGSTLTVADSCDGAGGCADRGTKSCSDGFTCNAAGTDCLTECTQQTECVAGYWCETLSKQCLPKKGTGVECGNGFECTSTRCIDGVCCTSDCDGTCERCDLAASPGSCLPVADGDDQQNECAGTGTCGGVCDGARACRFPDNSTTCVAASCADGLRTPPQTCDGAGACATVSDVWCNGFACQGSACGTSCDLNPDCAAGYACDVGSHVCRGAPGSDCDADGDCASGVCAGGRCCSGACAHADATCGGSCDLTGACSFPTTATSCGTCQICDGNGACLGTPADDATCATVDCSALSTVCATYGTITTNRCAAFGECKAAPGHCAPTSFAGAGTVCLASTCAADSETRHQCDGSGTCDSATVACAPYVCGPSGTCLTTCLTDDDCETGLACHVASGSCRGATGDACSTGDQCGSGFCVDGVCCDGACDGTCERCDLAGSKGACAPVAAGDDPDEECAGTGTCGGTCDGARACAYPGATVSCGLCTACDAAGACAAKPDDDPACGTITCSALSTTCRSYTDLLANRCAAVGECVLPTQLTCTSFADADDGTACTCAGGGAGACAAGICECATAADAGTPDDGPTAPDDAAAPAVDAGTAGVDAGAPGADAGSGGAPASGCGCRAADATPGLLPGLLILGLFVRRRRRR